MSTLDSQRDALAFLGGGGEMGGRMRAFDWASTPLGAAENWSQSLKTAVRIMLTSRQPMWCGWGKELIYLYNDAYKAIIGGKHPRALGQPTSAVWREIWTDIGPMLSTALTGDEGTYVEEQLLVMERNGYREETYYTFSYSPIPDESGQAGGIICANVEDTLRVIGDRQLTLMRELAAGTSDARTWQDACVRSAKALRINAHDIPFALIYCAAPDGLSASLAGTCGIERGHAAAPENIATGEAAASIWPIFEALRTHEQVLIKDLNARFDGSLPSGAWRVPPSQAVVLPLHASGKTGRDGVLIVGLNPFRLLDDSYRGFLSLVAGQIAASIANAEAYEEEARRAAELAKLDRAKTAFFSNVSHEFRTPLTLMLGPVEDLLATSQTHLSPAAKNQLELVNRNGVRLLRLVNTLLDFSRIEAGRVRALFLPTDLATFTAELASVFRSTCERAGLTLTVDCPLNDEPVYVDREMWEKIVLNLLSNAFKFTLAGEIAVTLRQNAQAVELQIRDTGTGIPAEEMPRLFERFHRVENAKGRTHEGSGIGLALVQELVKLHGGTVSAFSSLDKGTTFVVSLPVGTDHLPVEQIGGSAATPSTVRAAGYVEEASRWLPDGDTSLRNGEVNIPATYESLPAASAEVANGRVGTRPVVLVADDNADMRQYITRLLSENYRVVAVSNGAEAVEKVRQAVPDLVLTDVMMPRLDGFGLVKALRASRDTRGLPVIMLSARAGEESRLDGMEAGADDYVVKPFSARELLARVGAHLQMARMRREADQAIRESEKKLRSIYDGTHEYMGMLAPDGTLLEANRASLMFAGSAREDVIGKKFWECVWYQYTPCAPERIRRAVERAARGEFVRFDATIINPVGDEMYFDISFFPVLNEQGEVVWIIPEGRDITELKQTELKLQDANRKMQAVLKSITDGLAILDRKWCYTYMSEQGARLVGVRAEDLLGKCVWDLFPHAIGTQFHECYYRAVETGLPEHFEEYYPEPINKWLELHCYPSEEGLSVYFQDCTDRRKADDALRASEQRFRLLADAAPVMIWISGVDAQCSWFNKAWLEYGGHSMEQEIGMGWAKSLHPDDSNRCLNVYQSSFDERRPFSMEYRLKRHDGEYRWLFDNGTPWYGPEGEFKGYIGSCIDIHERKRSEEALREADRRKDDFLATLAHELRNPLAPLRTGLQVMKIAKDNPALVEQNRAMMDRQLAQMVRLIDDLLDVSRVSRGKIELQLDTLDLATAVQSGIETARPLIEQAHHILTVTLPPKPIYVKGDATRLSQIFSNLLNNAAKFSEKGGAIWISVERAGNEALVRIKDKGVGIPAPMLASIFDMFTQVNQSLDKAQGGLGIGLSLVRGLIELHGGTVEARSEGVGTGSEFIVRLPVFENENTGSSSKTQSVTPADGSTGRLILVVDDNYDSAGALGMFLELAGHKVEIGHDGLEALEMAERLRPDAILLDIGMPKLDGYETCRRIRQQPWGKSVFLVAQTGWGAKADRERTKEAGFDTHLVKPIDPDALVVLLAERMLKK